MDKDIKKYTMIQISKETHDLLKEYCKDNAYKMGPLVEKLIKREIHKPKPENVLRVKT